MRIHSPGGQKLQTLYRGGERRDEIVAREILLVRPTTPRGASERLEVLLVDVLSATIHLDETAPEDPKRPDTFNLRADTMLIGLSKAPTPVAEGIPRMPIDEARAWGNVDFRGGDYRISSHRAMFRRSTRTLHFRGEGSQKVQILVQGSANIPAANEMEAEWIPGQGYRFKSRPAGGQWSARRLEDTLRLFGRDDVDTPEGGGDRP